MAYVSRNYLVVYTLDMINPWNIFRLLHRVVFKICKCLHHCTFLACYVFVDQRLLLVLFGLHGRYNGALFAISWIWTFSVFSLVTTTSPTSRVLTINLRISIVIVTTFHTDKVHILYSRKCVYSIHCVWWTPYTQCIIYLWYSS